MLSSISRSIAARSRQMKKTVEINAERINALRTKRGLSQKELARRLKVDSVTVSRWERGKIHRIRQDIFGKLCSALEATRNDVCGDGPLPQDQNEQRDAQKGQMNLSVDTACRNALSLVALRYGVTRQQIVEAAPLLFFIAAEKSLQERRKRLDALRAAADAVSDAYPAYLPITAPVDDETLDCERRSIEVRDLFGSIITDSDNIFACYAEGWDEGESNPFAVFLKAALGDISNSATFERWEPRWSPTYEICVEEAETIVGSDKDAADAILSGRVALHEMPKDVQKSPPLERAKWAHAEAIRTRELALADLIGESSSRDGGPAESNGERTP